MKKPTSGRELMEKLLPSPTIGEALAEDLTRIAILLRAQDQPRLAQSAEDAARIFLTISAR